MKTCYDKLREMTDEDVDLLPYRRDGLEAELADQFKYQSWMVYAKVYTICFENIAKHPVHTCCKQLGLVLEDLKKCDDFRKKNDTTGKRPGKDKNWRDFNLFYTHCNTRWAKRNMHLIKKNFFMFGPLVNYLQEGDVDERETESPPRCNLPTPRDEVQAPFFDSSLSHEALSIQTPQEVLSSQMSPQPTEGDGDERETESPPRCNLPTPRDEVQTPFFDSSLSLEALSIQTHQEVLSSQMSPQPTVGNANNDEEVEVGNPNNDEEVGDGIPNNDVIDVEVGNNNNDVLDAGVDNHDEGELQGVIHPNTVDDREQPNKKRRIDAVLRENDGKPVILQERRHRMPNPENHVHNDPDASVAEMPTVLNHNDSDENRDDNCGPDPSDEVLRRGGGVLRTEIRRPVRFSPSLIRRKPQPAPPKKRKA